MVQILRIDNPLFAPGLNSAQRLCYFNAMTHFLYALPRLIFLTAPLIYLILGHTNVPGYWAAIFAYAFPHLILSALTNSRIQGQHRHSFWNEIYETVLAPYIFIPTMLALFNPRAGAFNVTAKGGVVNKSFFDAPHRAAVPCAAGAERDRVAVRDSTVLPLPGIWSRDAVAAGCDSEYPGKHV